MDFEKIKEFWKEKKQLVVIGLILVGGVGWYFNQKNTEVDNSEILSTQIKENKDNISDKKNNSSQNKKSENNTKVTCDISGAVKHGGVYTLKSGSRLMDLIEAAGGLHERAEIKSINRAQLLKDQDQIYVPYKGEKVDIPASSNNSPSENAAGASNNSNSEQVHLNSATVADLQKLTGIGQKKAEQIIQYRDQNGGFKQIEDLTKVSGIGEKTFEKLKDQLAL